MANSPDIHGDEFFTQVASYLPLEQRHRVREAFELARREHGDDVRMSGEPFFIHPLTVATYLANYFADAPTLIAALLHDVAEDTSVSLEDIEAQFGKEVGRLVAGLTKFDRVTAKAKLGREISAAEAKNATLHKLFETMTGDMRVGLIKIFDRLHNMRTIKSTPLHKQQEKSRETLSVYAPLANRFGMWLVKNELQRLALEVLDPLRYKNLCKQLKAQQAQVESDIEELSEPIKSSLALAGVPVLDILPAQEDILKAYETIKGNGSLDPAFAPFEANSCLVILLKDVNACYVALGHVHKLWGPVPGKFDDYIAVPRDNMYRSLHTTVIYGGRPIKIRLRTFDMQIESQTGILAQWRERSGMPVWSEVSSRHMQNLIETISENIDRENQAMDEGVRHVLEDVFSKQIIVYTPDGDMRELPQGSTPIDFAYTIHTAVGNSCRAAIVNGKHTPLNYQLKEGDSVTILNHGDYPQRSWLDEDLGYLQTSLAKAAVRRWFRRLPSEKAVKQGKSLLQAELAMLGLSDYSHLLVAGWFGYQSNEDLYHALGRADLLPTSLATKVLTDSWTQEPVIQSKIQKVASPTGEWFVILNAGDRPLSLCGHCNPRPGKEIVGNIRKNGKVTVHHPACHFLRQDRLQNSQRLKLRWGEEEKRSGRLVSLKIEVHDRDGLLSEIADLLSREKVNITMLCSRTIKFKATIILVAEMSGPRQVVRLLHQIKALTNVITINCHNYPSHQITSGTNGSEKAGHFCPFDYPS